MNKPGYLLWILTAEAVGFLSGMLSRQGIERYSEMVLKPPLSPPPIIFPIVWTILYALMGTGAARIHMSAAGADRNRALNVYIIQLVINFFWSLIFFNAQAYGAALIWLLLLWTLVLMMTVLFYRVDRRAGLLQIPYVLWITAAAYLNYGVWKLNR